MTEALEYGMVGVNESLIATEVSLCGGGTFFIKGNVEWVMTSPLCLTAGGSIWWH